ncbi:MAG: hypothetical protein JNJ61_26315 [Anaerolineae bacterium]|nr:hypothetical protein [Anaerolineae bacterium]
MPKESKTIGISLPDDFDVDLYDEINQKMSSPKFVGNPAWSHFVAAWRAIGYRYRALSDHDALFGEYIVKTDTFESRYVQERELFSFFVTASATLDSYSYALFALGSMLDPNNFPIMTDKDQRRIRPDTAKAGFLHHFPGERISIEFQKLVESNVFSEISTVRNMLAHRVSTTRIISLSNKQLPPQPHEWKMHPGFILDANATHSRRLWIADWLNKLLEATDQFAQNQFS